MSELLIYILVAWGITATLSMSSLTRPLRERLPARLRKAASCPQCVGFWVGLLLALTWGEGIGTALCFGFAASGVSLLLGSWTRAQQSLGAFQMPTEVDGGEAKP